VAFEATIKVHLGGSRTVLEDYVNIDKYLAFRHEVTQDDAVDFMKRQPAESVEHVITKHMIEHLPRERADGLIRYCFQAMIRGAEIFIECPNVRYGMQRFLEDENGHWLNDVFGLQRHGGDYHLWGYTPESLRALLEKHGFEVTYVGPDSAMQRTPEAGIQIRAVKP
jgi:predicted SAM-dependent methyltransferase